MQKETQQYAAKTAGRRAKFSTSYSNKMRLVRRNQPLANLTALTFAHHIYWSASLGAFICALLLVLDKLFWFIERTSARIVLSTPLDHLYNFTWILSWNKRIHLCFKATFALISRRCILIWFKSVSLGEKNDILLFLSVKNIRNKTSKLIL